MRISDTITYIVIHIFGNIKEFILTNITIFISLILILHVADVNDTINSSYNQIRRIEKNYDCLYKLDIPLYDMSVEYGRDVLEFVLENEEVEWYEYTSIPFEEKNIGKKATNILFISEGLIKSFTDVDDKSVVYESGEYYPLIVGYDISKEFPVGTILTDTFSGRQYQVTQILEKGTQWLELDVPNGKQSVKVLDEMVITMPDMHYYEDGLGMLTCIDNLIVVESDNMDSVKEQILASGKKHQLSVEIESFDEIITEDKKQYSALYDFALFLNVFIFVAMLIFVCSVSIVSWLMKKRELGILLTFGYMRGDIFKLILLENCCRLIIPFTVIIILNFLGNSSGALLVSNPLVLLEIYIFYIIIMVFVSLVIYKTIGKSVFKIVKG